MVKNVIKLSLLFVFFNVFADDFLTQKIGANFNQTWHSLYLEVKKAGFTTAYLQRCDFALKERDYESDKYRILFFGEYEKMKYLSKKYPQTVPYLPLKIIVIEENKNSTTLLANPPQELLQVVQKEDEKIIKEWQKNIETIMQNIANNYNS